MRFAIVTNVPKSVGRVAVKDESERRGHVCDFYTLNNLHLTNEMLTSLKLALSEYDLVHIAGGLNQYLARDLDALLRDKNIFCVNSYQKRVMGASSKIVQAFQFALSNLPIPKSVLAIRSEFTELVKELGLPFVLKRPVGAKGSGVFLVKSEDDLLERFSQSSEWLAQEFVNYSADYRVHVAGNSIFCPYQRVPNGNEFRANVSLGGSLVKVNPGDVNSISELASRAAAGLGYDYCGVDLLKKQDGSWCVLEVNSDPGFESVEQVTQESFSNSIVDFYENSVTRKNITK